MGSIISRRKFIETSAKGAAAIALIPSFLKFNTNEAFAGVSNTGNIKEYYARFNVTEEMLSKVISEAMSRGGDYCDLFFQHSISNDVVLEDNQVNRAYSNVDFGVGIRVIKGDQTGYSFAEDITLSNMLSAAKTAANIADSGKLIKAVNIKEKKIKDIYPIEIPWEKISISDKIPLMSGLNEKIFALDSRVIKATVSCSAQSNYILAVNSEGNAVCDFQPVGRIMASCTAESGGKKETNFSDLAARKGFEMFSKDNIRYIAENAVKKTMILFDAVKPQAGEMEVVLAAGDSGILLHEAIGHGMEADFNRKKESIYSDMIGKYVANKFVNIVDNALYPELQGSINTDDECNDAQETYLVEDGVLTCYMHDRISSKHYNLSPTGNGRRQSFRHIPLPRMRNTYMTNGPHKKEEIIASVKSGIYCENFTNGQVLIGPGDFTFYVKNGYLIENGKLTKPIKDVNIIGNGPQMLKDITMVADDFAMAKGGWTCGKNGQSVPVSMGLPTVKVSKITVGGIKK
jgi:TldD protein